MNPSESSSFYPKEIAITGFGKETVLWEVYDLPSNEEDLVDLASDNKGSKAIWDAVKKGEHGSLIQNRYEVAEHKINGTYLQYKHEKAQKKAQEKADAIYEELMKSCVKFTSHKKKRNPYLSKK